MANTASPHWEVVGKGKKSKIPTPVSRGERKKIAEGMPKVEHHSKQINKCQRHHCYVNICIELCCAIEIICKNI
jgi:hypothetical protein